MIGVTVQKQRTVVSLSQVREHLRCGLTDWIGGIYPNSGRESGPSVVDVARFAIYEAQC